MENKKKQTTEAKILNNLVALLLSPILIFVMMVNLGMAAKLTWNLAMPTIFGLPVLTLPMAVLLVCTVNVFNRKSSGVSTDNRTTKEKRIAFASVFISPWILYLIALITFKLYI